MLGAFRGRSKGDMIIARKFTGTREHKRVAEGFFSRQRLEMVWEDEQEEEDFIETREAFWEDL